MNQESKTRKEQALFKKHEQTGKMRYVAEIFELNRGYFHSYLRHKKIANIEDVIQEGWVKIQSAFERGKFKFSEKASIRTWMVSVIWNEMLDEMRRKKREPNSTACSMDILVGKSPTYLSNLLAAIETEMPYDITEDEIPGVVGLHLMLPRYTHTRNLPMLAIGYRIMGLKFDEIARITGHNPISLRVAWIKGVKAMRALYDEGVRNPDFTHQHLRDMELEGKIIVAQLRN